MPKATMLVTITLFDSKEKSLGSNTFESHDLGYLAGKINYWLRLEVAPYWPPNTLRMVAKIAPSSDYTSEAIRHMLMGIAAAWRMRPSRDPEDMPDQTLP